MEYDGLDQGCAAPRGLGVIPDVKTGIKSTEEKGSADASPALFGASPKSSNPQREVSNAWYGATRGLTMISARRKNLAGGVPLPNASSFRLFVAFANFRCRSGLLKKIFLAQGRILDTVHLNSMLTIRQQEILDFIVDCQRQDGVTPSTREIQEHFGFASQTAVMDHLRALERKGALKRPSGKMRALIASSTLERAPILDIPIFGVIPAGLPADQQQEPDGCISVDMETLRLPKGARVFALKVRGDSMIGAGILEGDVVVLEFKEAGNGDIVAALIDGETTLKRYVVQRGKPFLKAENPRYRDLIPAQELVIQGVQVALLRVVKR